MSSMLGKISASEYLYAKKFSSKAKQWSAQYRGVYAQELVKSLFALQEMRGSEPLTEKEAKQLRLWEIESEILSALSGVQ